MGKIKAKSRTCIPTIGISKLKSGDLILFNDATHIIADSERSGVGRMIVRLYDGSVSYADRLCEVIKMRVAGDEEVEFEPEI